ncbi:hypothetical protein ES703_67722 [subsurface metagenome]
MSNLNKYDTDKWLLYVNQSKNSTVGLDEGAYTYFSTAKDNIGNENLTEIRTLTIDTTNPQIDFVYPTKNSGALTNLIEINVTATDDNLDTITIRLYNSTNNLIETNTSSTPFYINYSGLNDGLYFYNATANDSAGNSNSTETRNITLDATPPIITFVFPTENSGVSRNRDYIEVNVTASDTGLGLDSIVIRLYNSTNDLINSSITTSSPNYINFSGLDDGLYFYNATTNDTLNNQNSTETRNITLDNIPPLITIVSPLSQTYTVTTIDFNVSLNEVGNWCGFSLDGDANVTMTKFNNTYFNYTKSSITEESHNITFACNDTAGNMNASSGITYFTVEIPAEAPPSGGGNGAVTPTINIAVDPTEINLKLPVNREGVRYIKSVEQIVKVTNLNSDQITVNIGYNGLDGIYLDFKNISSLILAGKETKSFTIVFTAGSEEDNFVGNIIVGNKQIPTSLNVGEFTLFDSNIVVLNKDYKVAQGDKLKTQVTLIPLGDEDRLDVTLNYEIKDYDGEIYLTQSETVLVEKQMNFKRNFDTGGLPLGKYIMGLQLVYPGGVAPSSAHFEIIERVPIDFGNLVFYLIIAILVAAIFIVIIFIIRKRKQKSSQEKSSNE